MFTRGQAIEFIEKAFGAAKLSNGGLNASVHCPNSKCSSYLNADKKKFIIHTNSFLCHCWCCDLGVKHRNFFSVLRKYKGMELANEFLVSFLQKLPLYQENEETVMHEVILPSDFTLLAENKESTDWEIQAALSYLKKRNVSEDELWYWRFGITYKEKDYKRRIIIPSYDANGKLNFFTTRAINDYNKPKNLHCITDKKSIVFNELNIDWTKELVLVEGPFDLINCNQNATCLLGSSIDKSYLLFQKIVQNKTPVVLALDDDVKIKMFQIAQLLHRYDVEVKLFELPEGIHDVGDLGKDRFISLLPNAKLFDEMDYFKYRLKMM